MTDRLDAAALTRMATDYLARYAASTSRLRRVLERRVRRWHEKRNLPVPEGTGDLLAEVLACLVEMGLVDDRAFALGKARTLVRKGLPARRIRTALRAEGLDAQATEVDDVLDGDDVGQAHRYAARKRLGPHRGADRVSKRDKDLRALMRAGFSFGVARAAVDAEGEPPPDRPGRSERRTGP